LVLSVSAVAVLLAVVWILSTMAFVWLIRSLMKLVLKKASAENLPKVLDSLTPLLSGLARILFRRPSRSRDFGDEDRTLEP
jgi:hypothetical protein